MRTLLGLCVLWSAAALSVRRGGAGGASGASGVSGVSGAGEVRAAERAAQYALEATLLLNEAARRDREVGYKIRAKLHVQPVWAGPHYDYLLKFNLVSPQLLLRGKHATAEWLPHASLWDRHADTTFYAHWQRGVIQSAYLDTTELPDVVNFKRGLISLFQFQALDVEVNETDVSGTCDVLYETLSMNVIRKIKRGCSWEGASSDFTSFRRVTRVTLSEDASEVSSVYAEELAVVGEAAGEGEGVKARSWTHLRLEHSAPAQYTQEGALESHVGGGVRRVALPAELTQPDLSDQREELSEVLSEYAGEGRGAGAGAEEAAGGGGGAAGAWRLLRVLAALEHVSRTQLDHALHDTRNQHALTLLVRALGLTGSALTHGAAARLLRLRAADALRSHAHTYLQALATSTTAHESVILDVLQLGVERGGDAVGRAALLAAGGAAGGVEREGEGGVVRVVRDRLMKVLDDCDSADEECQCVCLQALGNLRAGSLAGALLARALPPAPPRVALAALAGAGRAAGARGGRLAPGDRLKLLKLAVTEQDRVTYEVRARALLLFCAHATHAAELGAAVHALHALHATHAVHELRRVLWQSINSTAAAHVLDPALLASWDQRAHAGTSMVTSRALGWGWGGSGSGGVWLHSAQLAARGVLRRGEVTLSNRGEGGDEPLLQVEVWTRGLEAFAGGAGEEAEGEGEAAGGGLALSVGGVRMSDITLFNGQAELLGHVWAGTCSTWCVGTRAAAARRRAAVAPLQHGVALHAASDVAHGLALDAQVVVSLWSRNARAELALRAAHVTRRTCRVHAAWHAARARADTAAEPRLHVQAHLDFYSDVAVCVRTHTDDFTHNRTVWLSSGGVDGVDGVGGVRRVRAAVTSRAGRTLALGTNNDVTCRAFPPQDDADL